MSVTVHRYPNKDTLMAVYELETEQDFELLIKWFEQETFDQHIYLEDEGLTYSSIHP